MIEILSGFSVFLASILVVVAVAITAHWGVKRDLGFMFYISYPILLVYGLSILLSGRSLSLPDEFGSAFMAAKNPAIVWIGRFSSLFVIFACGERILKRFFEIDKKPVAQPMLFTAFWFYFLTNTVSPALLGKHTYITHEFIYALLAGHAALLVNKTGDVDRIIRALRNGLFVLLVASAACLLWKPDLVMQTNYHGLIPKLSLRYAGLSNHANSMGPLCVVFMMCLWRLPYPHRWLTRFGWALGGASLLLTQSKTSWIAFILCAACLLYFSHREDIRRRLRDFRNPHLPVLLILMVMFGGALLCLGFMFGDIDGRIAKFFSTQDGADLISFTGRDLIWNIAVEEWHKNPIFGYGLTIWDVPFRISIGLPNATHAHSQFFQSLSSAGLVGVTGLVAYATTLTYFVCKTARASEGLSVALFVVLLCKSISEVPLSMTGMSVDLIAHTLLLAVLATYYLPARRATARPVPRAAGIARRGLM